MRPATTTRGRGAILMHAQFLIFLEHPCAFASHFPNSLLLEGLGRIGAPERTRTA